MADKKENKISKDPSDKKEKELEKLMEEHPYETMSQVENRYGEGREKTGSDGSHQDGRGSNH